MVAAKLYRAVAFVAALAFVAAARGESYVTIPLKVEPPQKVRAVVLRAAGQAYSCPVRAGRLIVAAVLPLPWTVEMTRFAPARYTGADLDRKAPLVLFEKGELRFRLSPPPPDGEEVDGYFLRSGDATPAEADLVVRTDGMFRAALSPGIYAAAFAGGSRSTRIRSGIVIRPGEPTDVGELSFQPAGSVTLRVLDEKRHRPVPGARVTWSPPDALNADVARVLFSSAWSGITGRDGTITISPIGPPPLAGQWTVTAPTYVPSTTLRALIADSRRVTIPDTLMRQEAKLVVDVFLPRDAQPFRNAWLALEESRSDGPIRFKTTARQRLHDGENTLRLTSFGRRRLAIESEYGQELFFEDVELSPTDQRLTIAPRPCEIDGVVRGSGKRIEGVHVTAADPHDAYSVVGRATTDAQGNYTLTTFQSGEILVYATAKPQKGSSAQPVLKLARLAGEPEVRVDFDLPAASATLVVVDAESGAPLRAQLQGRLAFGGRSRGVFLQTDSEGRAKISGAPAGEATLVVRASGYRARSLTVDVKSHGEETRVELTKGGGISGRVVDVDGEPVAGATIIGGFASPLAMQNDFQAVSDSSGAFELTSVPEPSVVSYIIAAGHALGVAVLNEGAPNEIQLSPPNTGAITLLAGSAPPRTLLLFLAAPAGGTVIPYRALQELAAVNGLTPFQLLSSGSDGRLILPEFLPTGEYTLVVVSFKGKPGAEQYQTVADLHVPAPMGAVFTLPAVGRQKP